MPAASSGTASPTSQSPVARCAALADDTRWDILCQLGDGELSASQLADLLPVTRQAIARHLGVLHAVGLVEQTRDGRQVKYRAVGSQLSRLAGDLDAIGRAWEQRLDRLARLAESRANASGG